MPVYLSDVCSLDIDLNRLPNLPDLEELVGMFNANV